MRVGIGYDADAEGTGRSPLDVICGALGSALLGAVALPAADPWAEEADGSRAGGLDEVEPAADSGRKDPEEGGALRELAATVRRLERENYQVVNADVVLRADAGTPGLVPAEARARLAEALHTSPAAVSVRLADTVGVPGPGEGPGVAALVAVLVDQIEDTDAFLAALRSGG